MPAVRSAQKDERAKGEKEQDEVLAPALRVSKRLGSLKITRTHVKIACRRESEDVPQFPDRNFLGIGTSGSFRPLSKAAVPPFSVSGRRLFAQQPP
ncbi:hypothetical protein KM043_016725 [Ampulex compressa]|nr:hypothetical protein KM043_016725 [Ampulex compressa]